MSRKKITSWKKKKTTSQGDQKKKKKKREEAMSRKAKEGKKWRRRERCSNKERKRFKKKKKKKRNILNAAHVPVESAHEDFCHLPLNFPSSIFLPILVRKLFGGLEEKILEFHHYFLPSLSQPNTIKKVFIPHFFHPLKSTTKHTINVINFFNFPLKIMVDQLFL